MLDVAAALTNSVDRAGSGGMLADLNMNGFKVTGAAPGTADTDLATVGQVTGAPIGAVMDFAGAEPPSGWLTCGGQSLSRTAYASLFAVIGTTYGAADANSFNLPDCRGRVTAGADFTTAGMANRLTGATMSPSGADLGATGGAETHTLTQDEMPSHTHTVSGSTNSAGAHTHTISASGIGISTSPGQNAAWSQGGSFATSVAGAHSHTISVTADNTGGGGAHAIVQPTILFNKIIYAGTD